MYGHLSDYRRLKEPRIIDLASEQYYKINICRQPAAEGNPGRKEKNPAPGELEPGQD
ncbi:MAG: hypothetical protein AB1611_08105 [bacterium]